MFLQTCPYTSQLFLYVSCHRQLSGPCHLNLRVLTSLPPSTASAHPPAFFLLVTFHGGATKGSRRWGTRDKVVNRDTQLQPRETQPSNSCDRECWQPISISFNQWLPSWITGTSTQSEKYFQSENNSPVTVLCTIRMKITFVKNGKHKQCWMKLSVYLPPPPSWKFLLS